MCLLLSPSEIVLIFIFSDLCVCFAAHGSGSLLRKDIKDEMALGHIEKVWALTLSCSADVSGRDIHMGI